MEWQLLFVLHNIDMNATFESDYLAIVGSKDKRLAGFASKHPAGQLLLDGFKSTGGQKVNVSVVIVRTDAPKNILTTEAVYSFRNIFALASVTGGTQELMRHRNNWCITCSNFFDFYPVQLDKANSGLLTMSPVKRGWDEPSNFVGQPDPNIINTSILQPHPDPMLHLPLLEAWERYVKNPAGNRNLTVLFRSLETAYMAASLPKSSSIHEYGSRIALWVSAIEILAHPPASNANLGTVLDLFDRLVWNDRRLRSRRFIIQYPKIVGVEWHLSVSYIESFTKPVTRSCMAMMSP